MINLMFYPTLLASLVVVREKERGTIFNLVLLSGSPMGSDGREGGAIYWRGALGLFSSLCDESAVCSM